MKCSDELFYPLSDTKRQYFDTGLASFLRHGGTYFLRLSDFQFLVQRLNIVLAVGPASTVTSPLFA